MKKNLFLSIIFLVASCCVNKKYSKSTHNLILVEDKNSIANIESNIINSFLEIELKKNRYKTYENYPIYIIKEKISKLSSLQIYEYCYNDRNLPLKNSTNKEWILDNADIKKIKDSYNKNIINFWNSSDFTSLSVTILESSELKKNIKENNYSQLTKKLIIYLSNPLIIDKNNAFISFRIGDGSFGFSTIDSFTILMKKSKTGKWEIDSYYYDPNSTW